MSNLYVLEFQIIKSDLKTHNLGLYPTHEIFQTQFLNWFETKTHLTTLLVQAYLDKIQLSSETNIPNKINMLKIKLVKNVIKTLHESYVFGRDPIDYGYLVLRLSQSR